MTKMSWGLLADARHASGNLPSPLGGGRGVAWERLDVTNLWHLSLRRSS